MARHDHGGRSTGRQKVSERLKISGQFIAHRIEMLESPAFAALSYAALKMLTRLEIEHAAHAGTENGNLVVTYDDFSRAGVRRQSIMDGLAELHALGFLEITRKGRAAAYNGRTPSTYRLTYLNTKSAAPTDDWRKLDADAVTRSLLARRGAGPSSQDIDSRCASAPETVGAPAHPMDGRSRCLNAPDIRCVNAPEKNPSEIVEQCKAQPHGANDRQFRRGAA